jgi:endonuclease YncB( thermonuclease family)
MIRRTLTALLIAASASAHAGTIITGRVVRVSDGDTLTLLDAEQRQHVVRLDGIDAPEKGQPFGHASKRHLSDLAFDRDSFAKCHKTDRYRRNVCRVIVDDVDLGLEQLRAGLAWVFSRYAHELPAQLRAEYIEAERAARDEQRGLWSETEPISPWEWRSK